MDTNIDFKLSYPTVDHESWILWKLLKTTAIKPDYHFVSTIPVAESVIRSKFKFEPFPDSPETLELRLKLYEQELKINNLLIYIDGMKSISNVADIISRTIDKN